MHYKAGSLGDIAQTLRTLSNSFRSVLPGRDTGKRRATAPGYSHILGTP